MTMAWASPLSNFEKRAAWGNSTVCAQAGVLQIHIDEIGTSKYYAPEALLGRNGTFLASLAAMSLVTITSRHRDYRSHNQITLHHSTSVERQLPAPASSQIHGEHGTRVTVRNLFGNLPVRVKQRSLVLQQKSELHRLWDVLKKAITSLLLSWRGAVSLRIRDSDNKTVFHFNTSNFAQAAENCLGDASKPRSATLSAILNVLTQANYITIGSWASWVPASASTSALSIKGAISLDPAPSKNVQFISLGIRPLLAESAHNELYDEVNRLFALSDFGTIEHDEHIDYAERIRRQTDRRFKNGGYTNRQLIARKDVDRHPMFYLRISLNGGHGANTSEDELVADESSLQAVVQVLDAMITQWLSAHHFRPRQTHKKRLQTGVASAALSDTSKDNRSFAPESRPASTARPVSRSTSFSEISRPSSTTMTRRRKRTANTSLEPSERLQHRAFAEWSRIKSGKPDFFDNLPSLPKFKPSSSEASLRDQDHDISTSRETNASMFASFEAESIPQGAFYVRAADDEPSGPGSGSGTDHGACDDVISWTDPSTKKTYLLNSRTGCVMSDCQLRSHTGSSAPMPAATQKDMNISLQLVPRSATSVPKKPLWLDDVLRTWDNPIFKTSEKRIPHISLEDMTLEHGSHQRSHHYCPHDGMDKNLMEMSATYPSRLSKKCLDHAQVIAQVDRKFILVKMPKAFDPLHARDAHDQVMVLIDQHAADERVKVENLLEQLCIPLKADAIGSGYQSRLGHVAKVASNILEKPLQFNISLQEQTHFTTHAASFAAWGILFDVSNPSPSTSWPDTSSKDQCLLSVTSLPRAISERCKADPKLLISFLRSTVWKYTEDPHLPPLSSTSSAQELDWVRRLATCPPGLIDLINSRACRSAIMFNDVLSLQECEELLKKLATCVFPFMCAHGRPSMVPLIDLGIEGPTEGGLGEVSKTAQDSFVQAWKSWKR